MTKYLLILILLSSISQATSYPAVEGVWESEQLYCQDLQSKETKTIKILGLPMLGFEPQARLKIYETLGGGHNIEKEVMQSSCLANFVEAPYFLKATHQVNLSAREVNGAALYEMQATKLVSSDINGEAIRQCGSWGRGLVTYGLTRLRYPEYFKKEADRHYYISISQGRLYLVFKETDLCQTGHTIMLFKKIQ